VSELQEIGNEETTVVRLLAGDADRSPFTTGRNRTLVVDPEDSDPIILNICKVLGVLPRLILDVSVSRVVLSEEIPVVEEGLALVLCLQLILGAPSRVMTP